MPLPAPAVVFSRPGKVDVTTVEVPEPEPGEVLVRTVYSGVSRGTERWLLTGRYNHAGDLAARRLAIAPLITHRVPFAEAPSAYALVVDHPEQSLGMVLDWRDAR